MTLSRYAPENRTPGRGGKIPGNTTFQGCQERTENLNRAIRCMDLSQEPLIQIKNLKTNTEKPLGPDGFTGDSTKHLEENECQSFSNFPQKRKRREHILTHGTQQPAPGHTRGLNAGSPRDIRTPTFTAASLTVANMWK